MISSLQLRIAGAIAAVLAIVAVIALIYHSGSKAGADKVAVKAERAHTARVSEARDDERTAVTVTQAIAERTARADAQTDAYLQATIEDLRNALDATPGASADVAVPAAPADQLRASLNAGIDRANRAADAATASARADPD